MNSYTVAIFVVKIRLASLKYKVMNHFAIISPSLFYSIYNFVHCSSLDK